MNVSISVLMITYNGSAFIEEQLRSIDGQSHLSDIFILDDKSQDDFYSQLQNTTLTLNNKSTVEQNEENLGVLGNIKRIIALNHSKQWIALSDQDDVWKDDKLYTLAKYLPQNLETPILIYHDAEVIDAAGTVIHPSFWALLGQDHYEHRLETFLYGNFITGGSSLFNQALAKYAKDIPEDLNTLHDAWLGLCAFCFGQVVQVNTQLNQYRFHQSNVAFDKDPRSRKELILKKLTVGKTFLVNEIALVERFMITYHRQIPEIKEKVLKDFLRLKNQPMFFKRLQKKKILRKFKL